MRLVLKPLLISSKTISKHCYSKVQGKSRFPDTGQLFLVIYRWKAYDMFLRPFMKLVKCENRFIAVYFLGEVNS
jgi:hypothetical protein